MQAALDHLRAQGETLNDEDIARLSPLCHGHINMLGHYSFTLAELVTKGHLRPLKEASGQKTLLNVSFRSTERQTPLFTNVITLPTKRADNPGSCLEI